MAASRGNADFSAYLARLISGSAPASTALLASFGCIGITIHNAYGLTEATLVTLNVAGANRRGTVGAPLPQTQVRIAEDGEVLVKGPQVSAGCDGSAEQPLRDGWLPTGDLGHLEAGSLVPDGRKKDLIVTSYGKNIQPGKIETMLRGSRAWWGPWSLGKEDRSARPSSGRGKTSAAPWMAESRRQTRGRTRITEGAAFCCGEIGSRGPRRAGGEAG